MNDIKLRRENSMIGAKCDLKDRFAKNFLTMEDEYLIFSTRQHWSTLIPAFTLNVFLFGLLGAGLLVASILAPFYFFILLLLSLVVITISMEILIKQIVEWFFHFYIVTNRKIVEVAYRPMFSKVLYEVLLDQVRCTEVDVRSRGFSSEVFNTGTVLVTFDRPTKEKTFTIEMIKEPRKVAMHLADAFGTQPASSWFGAPATNQPAISN